MPVEFNEDQLSAAEKALLTKFEQQGTLCLSRVSMELEERFGITLLMAAAERLEERGRVRRMDTRQTYSKVGV
jgi:hypothetical protein